MTCIDFFVSFKETVTIIFIFLFKILGGG